jgi:hypothetical protein
MKVAGATQRKAGASENDIQSLKMSLRQMQERLAAINARLDVTESETARLPPSA